MTVVSGYPNWAKRTFSSSITAADLAERVQIASIHLEWAFTMSKYIFPFYGPAKSRWSLAHGWVGHCHGFSGATARVDW